MTPGKGSKYREFYDLSGRITCMTAGIIWPNVQIEAKTELSNRFPRAQVEESVCVFT